MTPRHYVIAMWITEGELRQAMLSMKVDSGPGPDLVPASFLLNCSENLIRPILILFNSSLLYGVFLKSGSHVSSSLYIRTVVRITLKITDRSPQLVLLLSFLTL